MSQPVSEVHIPDKTMGPNGDHVQVNGTLQEKELVLEKPIDTLEKETEPQKTNEVMEVVGLDVNVKSQAKNADVLDNMDVRNGSDSMVAMEIVSVVSEAIQENITEKTVSETSENNKENVVVSDLQVDKCNDTQPGSLTNSGTAKTGTESLSVGTASVIMVPPSVNPEKLPESQSEETEQAVSVTVSPSKDNDSAANESLRIEMADFDDLDEDDQSSESTFAPRIISESVVSLSSEVMDLGGEGESNSNGAQNRETLVSLNDTMSDEGETEPTEQNVWDDASPDRQPQEKRNGIPEKSASKPSEKSGEDSEGIVSVNNKRAQKSLLQATLQTGSLLKESDIKKEKEQDDCIMIDDESVPSTKSTLASGAPRYTPIQIAPQVMRPRLQNVHSIRAPQNNPNTSQYVVLPQRGVRPNMNGNMSSVLMPSSLFHNAPYNPNAGAGQRPPMMIPNVRGMNRGQFPGYHPHQHPQHHPHPQQAPPNINIFAPRTIGSSAQFTVVHNSSPRVRGSLLRGGGGGIVGTAGGYMPASHVQHTPPFTVLPSSLASRLPGNQAPRPSMVRIIPPGALMPPQIIATTAGTASTSGASPFPANSSSIIVNPTIGSVSTASKASPMTVTFTQAPIVAVSATQNKLAKIAITKPTANKPTQGAKKTIVPADTMPSKSKTARGGVQQYIPPNPPPHLKIPGKWRVNHTFLCRECGDVFLFRSSLRQHLERRSMLVNYFCTPCGKKLAFVNKCAMMNHRILHKNEAVQTRTESAIVTVLPPHMMPPLPSATQASREQNKKKEEKEKEHEKEKEKEVEEKKKEDEKKEEEVKKPAEKEKPTEENDEDKEGADYPPPGSVGSRHELAALLESRPDMVRRELGLDRTQHCTECRRNIGTTAAQRHRHFRKHHKNWQTLYKCERCFQNLYNPCAFAAHMRIHDKQAPYVCPVCGECMDGDRTHFLRHVKLRCMHFYQKILAPCPYCNKRVTEAGKVMTLGPVLDEHVKATHIDGYYKCTLCPLAYRTRQGLDKHAEAVHEGRAVETKQIFRCPCCQQITQSYAAVLKHVAEKLPEAIEESGLTATLQCPYCDTQAAGGVFRKHLLVRHGVHAVDEICTLCGTESRLLRDHFIHRVMAHTDLPERLVAVKPKDTTASTTAKSDTTQTPTIPQTSTTNTPAPLTPAKQEPVPKSPIIASPPPQGTELKRMLSTESLDVKIRKRKYSDTSEASSYTSEKQQKPFKRMCFPVVGKDKSVENFEGQVPTAPPPKARYPCSECDRKFVEKLAAQLHMQEAHGITPTFACHLCANTYTSKAQLDAHIKSFHEGRSQSLPFMCFICEEKNVTQGYKKQAMLEKHLLAVHKIHKNQIDYSRLLPTTSTIAQVSDTPAKTLRAGDGNFACAKCDFISDTRSDFQQHILRHRSPDSPSPQCQECGLCFTVLPALKRHVFIVHKIRDFDKYIESAGMKLEDMSSPLKMDASDSGLTPTNPTTCKLMMKVSQEEKEERRREREQKMDTPGEAHNALTCNVCYRDFADDVTLKKHLRVHGMAFIKSKRSRIHSWYDDE